MSQIKKKDLLLPLHFAIKQIIKVLICLLVQFGGIASLPMNKNTNTVILITTIIIRVIITVSALRPWWTLSPPVMS